MCAAKNFAVLSELTSNKSSKRTDAPSKSRECSSVWATRGANHKMQGQLKIVLVRHHDSMVVY